MRTSRRGYWFCVAALMVIAYFVVAAAAVGEDGDAKKPVRRTRGRLPAYYGQVVTEQQRQKIYDIQEDYRPKLEALETQRKALLKERDEKITAVLTPEQKQQIDAAALKRKQKAAPGDEQPDADSSTSKSKPEPKKTVKKEPAA